MPARRRTASRSRPSSSEQEAQPARACQHALRAALDVSAVAATRGRRRPHEAAGFSAPTVTRRRWLRGSVPNSVEAPLDGPLLIDKPAGAPRTTSWRACAARCARGQEGRPRRHARPVRHRSAGRPRRPGDQAGAVLRRPAQGIRLHGAVRRRLSHGRPHRRRSSRRATPARRGGDRGRAAAVPRRRSGSACR